MCWNATTSITSFIIGTLVNVFVMLKHKNSKIIFAICIIWQWILLMQLSEYFIWVSQQGGDVNKYATKCALVLNLTQPIFVYLILICILNIELKFKIMASILILFYICYMLIEINKVDEYKYTTPSENCTHLNLKWWKDIKNSGLIYCIILFAIIMLLGRPIGISFFTVFFIFMMLVMSHKFYGCGGPSMWCWFVVPFPFFLSLFYNQFYKY